MPLNDIQARFRDIMLEPPASIENPPEDFSALFHEDNIPLPARLKVYRNNIIGGLTDTLLASFPLLEKLVGRDFLERMGRSFVLAHPPEEGCLSTYGQGFDTFIAGFKPAAALPYLPDIAAFEIALNDSYYAQNDTALQSEALTGYRPKDLSALKIHLRESVRLVHSPYPLEEIRDFCMKESIDNGQTLNLDKEQDTCLMIYRPVLEVLIVALSPEAFMMIKALHKGRPLGEALENTLLTHPAFNFQNFLSRYMALEIFSSKGFQADLSAAPTEARVTGKF